MPQSASHAVIESLSAFRRQLAPRSDVWIWFGVSALIAATMLIGVAVLAHVLPGDPRPSSSILMDTTPTFYSVQVVFARNLLVLAIHLAACYVGAIIGREHRPLQGRWARLGFLHRRLPPWMARASLLYALFATLASVALQTTGLALILADIATSVGVDPWYLALLVLPHAAPELIGVFLPLALFLVQARRRELRVLAAYTRQSAYIALPLIFIAALLEAYVTPQLILQASL